MPALDLELARGMALLAEENPACARCQRGAAKYVPVLVAEVERLRLLVEELERA